MHIDNIHASFNTGYLSQSIFTVASIAQVVRVGDNMCIGGVPSSMLGMLLEKNLFLILSLSLLDSFFIWLLVKMDVCFILGDIEVTANLYCKFAYPYWEGCVIYSIYLR